VLDVPSGAGKGLHPGALLWLEKEDLAYLAVSRVPSAHIMKRAAPRAEVALDFHLLTVPELISVTRGLANNIPTNPNLAAADIAKLPFAPATLLASALALENTHTARPAAPSKVNTALELTEGTTVMDQFTADAQYLEALANTRSGGSYVAAESFLVSFGLSLKKQRAGVPRGFKVKSVTKGTATGQVPAAPKDTASFVRCSIDGGKTYGLQVHLTGGGFLYEGLPSGVECMFQYAVSAAPAKRAKAAVIWGSEAALLQWSAAIGCMVL
jgi:hypothetical protein